jgi:hypothetical protein
VPDPDLWLARDATGAQYLLFRGKPKLAGDWFVPAQGGAVLLLIDDGRTVLNLNPGQCKRVTLVEA